MNLPSASENLDAYLDLLLSTEYGQHIKSLVDRRKLKEATPVPWDSTPFPDTVEL